MPRRRALIAAALAIAGGVGFACPLLWIALGRTSYDQWPLWWVEGGWIVWLLVLHLPAALGLLAGSRFWTVLTAVILAANVAVALTFAWSAADLANQPVHILDRVWLLSPGAVRVAAISAACAAVTMLVLFCYRPRGGVPPVRRPEICPA